MKTRVLMILVILGIVLLIPQVFAQEFTPEPIPELTPHEEFTDEQICSHGAKLIDGICIIEKEIHDNELSTYLALFLFSMIPIWFVASVLYFIFGKKHKKSIAIILAIVGVLWILGIYTNTLPVSFG